MTTLFQLKGYLDDLIVTDEVLIEKINVAGGFEWERQNNLWKSTKSKVTEVS